MTYLYNIADTVRYFFNSLKKLPDMADTHMTKAKIQFTIVWWYQIKHKITQEPYNIHASTIASYKYIIL